MRWVTAWERSSKEKVNTAEPVMSHYGLFSKLDFMSSKVLSELNSLTGVAFDRAKFPKLSFLHL